MQEKIWIDAEIAATDRAAPIRFAHHKNIDRPENHVLHINNYIEIYVYVSGDHRYIVENALYDLKRGDIIVINPLEVHKALPQGEGLYERFYFIIDCDALDAMALRPLDPILGKAPERGNLISLGDEAREKVLGMLYEIADCLSGGKNDQLTAFSLFLRILSEINAYLAKEDPPSYDVAHTPMLLKKILLYVAEHTAEIDTTAKVAEALSVTPQYLSTYFNKYTGTSLKIYIQAKKIALAKVLLDKGADVTQACYDCGFNDCSYFIKVFKKYVGVTPLVYKQRVERQKG